MDVHIKRPNNHDNRSKKIPKENLIKEAQHTETRISNAMILKRDGSVNSNNNINNRRPANRCHLPHIYHEEMTLFVFLLSVHKAVKKCHLYCIVLTIELEMICSKRRLF